MYKRQVVKLKNGKSRYEWFPKCKLVENSDDIATSEEKASEQTDTIKIRAYPFDACLLYTSPSPRDGLLSRMPSSA